MPDVTSVLERAAAPPTQNPDVERLLRRHRSRLRVSSLVAVVVVGALAGGAIAYARHDGARRVRVSGPGSAPAPVVSSHGATITLQPGWTASEQPLNWWIHSPFELFSIATVPLPPSPHKAANEAACPSEIPATAVDNLPSDGAYLWIGLWRPREGLYGTAPRPARADGIQYEPGCALPHGEKAYLANLRDGTHDYPVTYVLGPDAPPSRKADIDRMLDSLDLSNAPPTNP